jgi:uncharacterized protein YbjT (DUF2867 family)
VNILVLGANGGTGVHVVEQAAAAGDRVIALIRGTNVNVVLTRGGVDLIHGDATSAPDLAKAMAGADVVISTLGGRGPSIMTDAVRAIIDAAHQAGMRRVVLMSSFAVERDRLGPMAKLMSNLAMGKAIADKTASERLLRSSDLEWTIVYPTVLTNKPASGMSRIVPDDKKLSPTHKVSRADVASWLLKAAKDPSFVGREVTISG